MESKEEIIFAGRAYRDYMSQYETDYLSAIRKRHSNSMIIELPIFEGTLDNILWGEGLYQKEKELFFPLIGKCDVAYVAPINNEIAKDGSNMKDKGKLTDGVKLEALYALSVGKKVYKYMVDETGIDTFPFQEIRGIFDSEELIKNCYLWDKYFKSIIDNRIKDLLKTEKRLPNMIHPKIIGLYERNPEILQIMNGFLSGGRNDIDYIKPIVIQKRYPAPRKDKKKYGGDSPIRYLPYGSRQHYSLKDLSISDLKINKGEIHFYETYLDTKVLDETLMQKETDIVMEQLKAKGKEKYYRPYMVMDKHVLGANITFDIDAPSEAEEKYGKVDMFDMNENWFEEFMTIKIAAENWFKNKGLKCLSFSTGGGFNVVGEPYWFDKRRDTLPKLREKIDTIFEDMNLYFEDKIKGVHVDEKSLDWSVYKKMVFTYHARWNRITLPVRKGRIDKEWFMKLSDLDYFINVDKTIERNNLVEVIEESNWINDKWW